MPFGVRSRLGLKPFASPGERVYAIGDIHGCFDLLQRLLLEIEADHMERSRLPARLIVLGDFIDRGTQSAQVLTWLRSIQENSDRLIVLMGNHESALLDCIEGDEAMQQEWLQFGGRETLQSFGLTPPRARESAKAFGKRVAGALGAKNLDWLRNLPLSTSSGDYFFCHAGIRPYIPLHRQDPEDLLCIREEFLQSDANHGAVVVHGHSVVADCVQFRNNRIGVDTGAYLTGKLSAVGLEGSLRWLVTVNDASSS